VDHLKRELQTLQDDLPEEIPDSIDIVVHQEQIEVRVWPARISTGGLTIYRKTRDRSSFTCSKSYPLDKN
jgi:ubiquitin-protein ligase